jgi:hypothetical protein
VTTSASPLYREELAPLAQSTALGKTVAHDHLKLRWYYFLAVVTERRLRPRARRRRRTARPPRVFMRARNPWVRFRLLLCGWYVRFTTVFSV